jgi:exopolysaccharide production protein ExoF
MPRKSHLIASISSVLVSLFILAAATPGGRGDFAHADEIARHENDETERAQDHRSLVLSGQLVRIADVNAASCERTPSASVDLKALDAAMKVQVVHLARLEADLQGRAEIALPDALQSLQSVEPVASALRDEQAALAARKDALNAQLASLNQDRTFSEREIELTTAKETSFERQQALAQKEFDKIGGLLNEGLVANQQKLTLQQNILLAEASRLDAKLAILRAQQEVSKIDRAISDLRNQWRSDSLAEFNKTRATLADLVQQAQAAANAAGRADPALQGRTASNCGDARETFYVIVRGPAGEMQAFPVGPKADKSPVNGDIGAVTARNGS